MCGFVVIRAVLFFILLLNNAVGNSLTFIIISKEANGNMVVVELVKIKDIRVHYFQIQKIQGNLFVHIPYVLNYISNNSENIYQKYLKDNLVRRHPSSCTSQDHVIQDIMRQNKGNKHSSGFISCNPNIAEQLTIISPHNIIYCLASGEAII